MLKKSPLEQNRTASTSAKVAKKHQSGEKRPLTVNPGDRIRQANQTIEEKSQQLAVHAPDITGDYINVPAYFVVEYPDGTKEALHHVRDAKKISDVVRQARYEDEDWEQQSSEEQHSSNLTGIVLMLALFALAIPILLGIF